MQTLVCWNSIHTFLDVISNCSSFRVVSDIYFLWILFVCLFVWDMVLPYSCYRGCYRDWPWNHYGVQAVLNSQQSSHFSLPRAEIIGMDHHSLLVIDKLLNLDQWHDFWILISLHYQKCCGIMRKKPLGVENVFELCFLFISFDLNQLHRH